MESEPIIRKVFTKKGEDFEIYDENVKGPNIFNKLPDHKKLDSYKMIYLSPGINIRKIFSKRRNLIISLIQPI